MNLYSAICNYERTWSEPQEEDEEEFTRQDYEEHMANMAGDR